MSTATATRPTAAAVQAGQVTVITSNTYACGRESGEVHHVAAPPVGAEKSAPWQWDDTPRELATWWDTVVQPLTGDGHPCESSEHAMYEATVTEAPGRPELVGLTWSAEG